MSEILHNIQHGKEYGEGPRVTRFIKLGVQLVYISLHLILTDLNLMISFARPDAGREPEATQRCKTVT